mgnify:CR=1 FL=1
MVAIAQDGGTTLTDSGFRPEHFALLQAWDGVARDARDAEQNSAYRVLVEAYEATAAWAHGIRQTLFPRGRVRKLSKPTDQGQKFKPYTWARIYPWLDAPKALAYTAGIDAVGQFCVKLDTVSQNGAVRHRYELRQGGDHRTSPFAAMLPAEEGLRLSREELIAWSVEAIQRFDPSYGALAAELGLLPPTLRIVSDPEVCRRAFQGWVDAMAQTAVANGGLLALPQHQVFLKLAPKREVAANLGLDPRGARWAVEINEPVVAGDYNVLSAIGEDEIGGRYLLRQGRLSRPPAPPILEEEFIARTGLAPVSVETTGRSAERRWFIVANLDDPPAAIRRDTARFVDLCWTARTPFAGDPEGPVADDGGGKRSRLPRLAASSP